MHRAAIGLILTIASFGWGAEVRYVATQEVLLVYATANQAPVERVDLWVTRDGGKTWSREPSRPCGPQTLAFQAPADGWYGFYLVLHNSAGVSADPPAAGTEPHSLVIVDTVAPVLQLHSGNEPPRIVAGCPSACAVTHRRASRPAATAPSRERTARTRGSIAAGRRLTPELT